MLPAVRKRSIGRHANGGPPTPPVCVTADAFDGVDVAMFDLPDDPDVQRIALVTQSWHLPRSVRNFEEAGFKVVPVPTGIPRGTGSPWLDALPSAQGLGLSRQVLREWLGLRLT